MTACPTAIIIGCGLAGPVAAVALARVGYTVTIYEARSASEGGAFLDLASNGLSALQRSGVQRVVATKGFATPRIVMWSGSGRKLGEVPNGMTLADGTSSITIARAALHQALRREAERHGITIVDERRVVEADTLAGGVAVARFEDGSGWRCPTGPSYG